MSELKDWTSRLLDLGKRNKLINYRDSAASSVEILLPDISSVFQKMISDTPHYDVLNADSLFPRDNVRSGLEKSSFITAGTSKMKAKEILLYKEGFVTLRTLNLLAKRTKDYLADSGINILYLAFGFLVWKDRTDDIVFRSPLVLMPVTLKADKAKGGVFMLDLYSDDIITNPTLSYKLKHDFGVTLPSIPDGETDIVSYIDSVRKVAEQNNWTVDDCLRLDIFSFQKLNMYNDINDNQVAVLNNPLVRTLLTSDDQAADSGCGRTDNMTVDENVTLHNVVDADSSQNLAIRLAKAGKSFVLQGPPGTGKSQTITNIIAESLYDGKKILFVSEKMAALQVVHNNLHKVGLADYCLELHSHKTNRKAVVDELYRVMGLGQKDVSRRDLEELEELKVKTRLLNEYIRQLHNPNGNLGLSPFEVFNYVEETKTEGLDYDILNIGSKNRDYLRKVKDALQRYAHGTTTGGYDYRKNPWYGYIGQLNFDEEDMLKKNISDIIPKLKELTEIQNFLGETGLPSKSFADIVYIQKYTTILLDIEHFSSALFDKTKLKTLAVTIQQIKGDFVKIADNKVWLDKVFLPEVYDLDGITMRKEFSGKSGLGALFSSDYQKAYNGLKKCAKPKAFVKEKILTYANFLANIQTILKNIEKKDQLLAELFPITYAKENTDWAVLEGKIADYIKLCDSGINLDFFRKCDTDSFEALKFAIRQSQEDLNVKLNEISPILEDIFPLFNSQVISQKTPLSTLVVYFESLKKKGNMLTEYKNFLDVEKDLEGLGALDYLIDCLDNNLPTSCFASRYEYLFYDKWMKKITSENSLLRDFNRARQDCLVSEFCEKDRMSFDITRAIIDAELDDNRPDLTLNTVKGEVGLLTLEHEKRKKFLPVRELLSKIPNLVFELKPCFLMSPLSVSTYLTNTPMQFDMVIFDEASQVFPEDGLGAIYRGKQVIVVGDSQQMPPTDFFATSWEDEEKPKTTEEEKEGEKEKEENAFEINVEDCESILEISNLRFPSCRLNWHYRSRNEQLISFSNHNFYNDNLVTFPSANENTEGFGVRFLYCENGVYDQKTRTNTEEAKMVAQTVFRCFEKYPDKSVGVVAFSQTQQDAIDSAIQKIRETDNKYNDFFGEDRKEPFFIKNLETVQGDERDIIIFSMGYGRNKDGRFLLNFGPLNKAGGERRLNVAVTRAKCHIILCASVKAKDIDLSRTTSTGSKMLHDYLEYAEKGGYKYSEEEGIRKKSQCAIVKDVAKFLEENGYEVVTSLGNGKHPIDIAVKHPVTKDFILAIESDGDIYNSDRSPRDRDRLRSMVLSNLGWKYYRLWSTEWIIHQEIEKKNLLEVLQNICGDSPINNGYDNLEDGEEEIITDKNIDLRENSSDIVTKKLENNDIKIPTFVRYNSVDEDATVDRTPMALINSIIRNETPISEEWLLRRLMVTFERKNVADEYKTNLKEILNKVENTQTKEGFIYIKGQKDPVLRVPWAGDPIREIRHISLGELANGMQEIVNQNGEISKKELFVAVMKALRLTHIETVGKNRLESALNLLINKKIGIVISGDVIKRSL